MPDVNSSKFWEKLCRTFDIVYVRIRLAHSSIDYEGELPSYDKVLRQSGN